MHFTTRSKVPHGFATFHAKQGSILENDSLLTQLTPPVQKNEKQILIECRFVVSVYFICNILQCYVCYNT